MAKRKPTRRQAVTYGDYGRVRVLRVVPTDRGGLALIAVRVPANSLFKKRSTQQFWVRAGAVGKPRYFKNNPPQIHETAVFYRGPETNEEWNAEYAIGKQLVIERFNWAD